MYLHPVTKLLISISFQSSCRCHPTPHVKQPQHPSILKKFFFFFISLLHHSRLFLKRKIQRILSEMAARQSGCHTAQLQCFNLCGTPGWHHAFFPVQTRIKGKWLHFYVSSSRSIFSGFFTSGTTDHWQLRFYWWFIKAVVIPIP